MLQFSIVGIVTFGRIHLFEVFLNFVLLGVKWSAGMEPTPRSTSTDLVESHTILDEKPDARVQEADITFEDEIPL